MCFILQIVPGARSHGSKVICGCKVVEVRSLCSEVGVESREELTPEERHRLNLFKMWFVFSLLSYVSCHG